MTFTNLYIVIIKTIYIKHKVRDILAFWLVWFGHFCSPWHRDNPDLTGSMSPPPPRPNNRLVQTAWTITTFEMSDICISSTTQGKVPYKVIDIRYTINCMYVLCVGIEVDVSRALLIYVILHFNLIIRIFIPEKNMTP